jgi:hypothetical protein
MACPASIRLSADLPDTTNEAAERGTEIHKQAEAMILGLPEPHPEHYEYAANYVDFVMSKVGDGELLLVEQVLSFERWAPGGFGTADIVIVPKGRGVAKIIDLKTGQQPVPATSKQLKIYALGLLERYQNTDVIIDAVEVSIWQNGKVDTVLYENEADLVTFAWQVMGAAKAALDPETKPTPSEDACRWCKARSVCTARAIHVLEQAGERMGHADLAAALPIASHVAKWAEDIQAKALEVLTLGGSISGYKLVEGQSRRRWRDDALELIEQAGMADLLTERKLITVTAAEKALGKREARPIMDAATERPAGKPVVATTNDPRPAIEANGHNLEDFT